MITVMVDPTDLDVVLKNCLEKDDIHRFVRDFIGYGTGFAPGDNKNIRYMYRIIKSNIILVKYLYRL